MTDAHTSFEAKHGPDARPDPDIREAVAARETSGAISCARAHKVARTLSENIAAVGRTIDLMGIRLTKCQLGLFGFSPEKKVVTPLADPDPALIEAIQNATESGRISCEAAWEIADRFGIPRMTVSGACETAGIKIKPCQLGAF